MNGWLASLDGIVFRTEFVGDAVEFVLGPQTSLFCLLGPALRQGGFPVDLPQQVLFEHVPRDVAHDPNYNVGFAALSKLAGEFPVPERFWPVMLWMRDRNDPHTALPLAHVHDRIDVRVTGVSMTITDAPISRDLGQKLPWLKGGHIAFSHVDLQPENFVRG